MKRTILLLLGFLGIARALTPSAYLTASDTARLKKVFQNSLPYSDLTTTHYTILGFSLLGEKIPDPDVACRLINSKVDINLEGIFHASSTAKLLGTCKWNVPNLQQKLESILTADHSLQDIYYSVMSMKNLNMKVDPVKVSKLLTNALKKDDSVWNLGYSFHVAANIQGDAMPFFERIEDVIVQADEVDGKHLQFEGGLSITSTTISGVYKLAAVVKIPPALTHDQAVKFTNYFLSRKFVQTVKGAAQLLDILKLLSSNQFHIPVSMTLASSSAISAKNPTVQVRITNVLGASLGALTVTADSAIRYHDGSVILNKKPFQPVKGSDILYSFNLMEHNPLRGFYKLVVSAVPAKSDSRLVGNNAVEVFVKVMTEVAVEAFEMGTIERDQTTSAKSTSVTYPGQLSQVMEADYHQKLFMKFALKDKSAKLPMTAHQVFVQFNGSQTDQEIVFVAEPDSSNKYRFDLDIFAKAKDFNYVTDNYEVNIIVGDAIISNPFTWKIGTIYLIFPQNPSPSVPAEDTFATKPEIKHVFREQEKRPSTLVSNTFSVLAFIPLLVLFLLWIKIGANVYNFPLSIYALGFHAGLAAIFGLFVCFWLHINMFDTLKYLAGIGVVTFLAGHKLLSKIARSKKS